MSSIFLLFASIASSIPFGNSMRVTAHVKDMDGNPAVGVTVRVQTYKNTLQGLGRSPEYTHYEGVTDTNGNATLSFQNYSCHFNMQVYSDNYYMESTNYVYIKFIQHPDLSITLAEHSKDISFTLRRKKNPTSLFYSKPSVSPKLPRASGEFGFDLLLNDWIEPYGEGKTADFYVQREASPTNSKVTVNSGIVFRGEGNGAYIRKQVTTTSDFKTDYEADTNEIYQAVLPLRHYPAPNAPMYTFSSVVKGDEYAVLRTRVEKNAKGEIVNAYYSVIYGPIHIDESFDWLIYAFNPTPNDPNLERDVEKSVDIKRAKQERLRQLRRRERLERRKNRLSSGVTVNPTPNDTDLEPKR